MFERFDAKNLWWDEHITTTIGLAQLNLRENYQLQLAIQIEAKIKVKDS